MARSAACSEAASAAHSRSRYDHEAQQDLRLHQPLRPNGYGIDHQAGRPQDGLLDL
jgi:hypothetical protein